MLGVTVDTWQRWEGAGKIQVERMPGGHWRYDADQQLCVFHVIQAMIKHSNKAMLTYRRGLPKETKAQKAIRKEL
ncbi:MAG: hypothetical protein GY832_09475 [Chloroflexi bacterium]|nr:hypothetical protein [Chloroflexota bacterium]